jgi:hypothetical protein
MQLRRWKGTELGVEAGSLLNVLHDAIPSALVDTILSHD